MTDSLLSYGPHELQTIKIFKQTPSTNDTIAFIHGGGWRDPNNTFNDFTPTIQQMDSIPINIVSINYRLSPRVNTQQELDTLPAFRHPLHLMDIVNAICLLVNQNYKITLLVGHSVGAGLCLQLLNYQEIISQGVKYLTEFKHEIFDDIQSQHISKCMAQINLKSMFLLDGIYDIPKLLQEYEYLRPMIRCAFDSDDHARDAFQLSNPNGLRPTKLAGQQSCRIYVIHSLQDELLSPTQSKLLYDYLMDNGMNCKLVLEKWGEHEEIYTRKDVGDFIMSNI